MAGEAYRFRLPTFSKNIITIVGGYGSGKSEIAVNLARYLKLNQSEPVVIADLDIINPYFRSREASRELANLGIKSLIPEGENFYAELPIIIPEIKTAIERGEGKLILDIGGDETGARVLSSLSDAFTPGQYELLLVLNARRPFTSDLAGCQKMLADIEAASRLKFSGLISNSHLMDETDPDTVLQGLELANKVSRKTNLPVVFISMTTDIMDKIEPRLIDLPVLALDRSLLKPWERKKVSGKNK
ncbi:MAG: cobalamin biosynthesis protein CbiA [candidate division Zixibacteria bacterium]|nr:cobalamin biosynthesis protein CbiA [candidate division Zixibacteria bacterium]